MSVCTSFRSVTNQRGWQSFGARSRRSWLQPVVVLLMLGAALTACDSNDATVAEPRPVSRAEAVEAVARGMDGVTSVHVVTDVVGQVEENSGAVLRLETWADLGAARERTILSEPKTPGSVTFVVTEESVVVDGSGYRRSGDSDWRATDDGAESMVLAGIDSTGDDLADSLRRFAQSESGDWTAATLESGVVTYRRTGDPDADNVVIDIGENGMLVSINLEQRPTGARPENPLFYRTTMTFDAFGETGVDVPSDLPLD